MLKIIKIICFIIIILFTQTQYANELLIYADDINYDSQENIVAKGNVKIISGTKILTSEKYEIEGVKTLKSSIFSLCRP